jgi:hypothetical protein
MSNPMVRRMLGGGTMQGFPWDDPYFGLGPPPVMPDYKNQSANGAVVAYDPGPSKGGSGDYKSAGSSQNILDRFGGIGLQPTQIMTAQQAAQQQALLTGGVNTGGLQIGNTNISWGMVILGAGVLLLVQMKPFARK